MAEDRRRGLTASEIAAAAAAYWAAFEEAAELEPIRARIQSVRRLARFLAHPGIPEPLRGIGSSTDLARVEASLRRIVTELAGTEDHVTTAETRHELAAFLWEYQGRLPGSPLREALAQDLRALRVYRRLGARRESARCHHLVGLISRGMLYGGSVRDQERAILHLGKAADSFLAQGMPGHAAEALFSAIATWGRRRIGSLEENARAATACWSQARRLFDQAGMVLRSLATDIEYAGILFARRYDRAQALSDAVDLVGSVIDRLGDLPAGTPQADLERRLSIAALSLLGTVQANRPNAGRYRSLAARCFEAAEAQRRPDDAPDFAATHRLRHASFLVREMLEGQVGPGDIADTIRAARADAFATRDGEMQVSADFLTGLCLAEAGQDAHAQAVFDKVLEGRARLVAEAGNAFGREQRAGIAAGLAAVGALTRLQREGPLAAVRFFEWARIGLGGRSPDAGEIDPAAIAAACPEDGAIVWLLPDRHRSAAILACRREGTLSISTIGLPSFNDDRMRAGIARWLRAQLQVQTAEPAAAVASMKTALMRLLDDLGPRLSRRLDQALRRQGIAPGAGVVLISTGILALLPLQAAPLRAGEVFADRYRLSGASCLADLRPADAPHHAAASGRALILTDPAELGPAGFFEADRVADILREAGCDRPRIVDRFGSVGGAVALLNAAPLIHVTAHGTFGFTDPLWSRIVIGDRQLAPIFLVAALDLHGCRLAFLASCGSGLADAGAGADLRTGIADAFREAGAHTVIGALWPVDDASAGRIVTGFYRHYLGGLRPAAALHAATQEVRAAFPHPFDWAPFAVRGLP